MKKRQSVMNWFKKYSKNLFFVLIVALLLGGMVFADVISGGIRKEYNTQPQVTITIPDKEPVYSSGAVISYNKGIAFFKMSDYNEAIDAFKNAVEQEPRFADAYFNLGILYDYFDNPKDAIIAFNRAYIINKNDYEALYYMIKCYVLLNDKVAARFYSEKIPKDSEFYIKTQQLLH